MISPELLRRFPYFGKISEPSLKAIAMMAEEKKIPPGTELFKEEDPANYLYIVTTGEVNIQYTLGNGERRTVDTRVEGDVMMLSALIEPYKSMTVGVTTKETHLIAIKAPELRQLCEKDFQVGYRVITEVAKAMARRLEGARVQLAAM